MNIEQLIREAYLLPPTVIEYHVSQSLKQLFPEKVCIEVEDGRFDVEGYADAQQCILTRKAGIHNQMTTYWLEPGPEVMRPAGPAHPSMQNNGMRLDGRRRRRGEEATAPEQETMDRAKNAWFEVQWQGSALEILCLGWGHSRRLILADTEEIARAFFVAVCKWNTELRGEILVFDGRWYKDENLFQDIKGATLDNLILPGTLKEEIQTGQAYFAAQRPFLRRVLSV